ncbi:MAG TPA: signal peptidase I [Candidatus Competibacteraceae bacterium]|nr:signal peptidase I [Candidatus Competibacteraceae bacterium]
MQFDFAAVLVLLTLVTGCVWLLDVLVLARRRERSLEFAATVSESSGEVRVTRHTPWYVDVSRSFFPVILAVLVLRSFVVEPFRIPSGSMMPTLLAGDFILVNKFSFGLRLPVINTKVFDSGSPRRGDVAVFRYPEDPSVAFIKRIVGLPGDRVQYRNKRLYINGEPVPLSSVAPSSGIPAEPGYGLFRERLGEHEHLIQVRGLGGGSMSWDTVDYVVPPGHYFVMGDNRDNSRDSRFWGPLPEENLIGKAFLIWMNWDCITGNGNCKRIGSSIE